MDTNSEKVFSRISALSSKFNDSGDGAESSALKEAISLLEQEVALLTTLKSELEKKITTFDLLYNFKLGDLISKLFFLRMRKAKRNSDIDSEKQDEYQETVKDYANYNNERLELEKRKIKSLSSQERQQLKMAYRKAAMRCHPDLVPEEKKVEAQSIFVELKLAFENNDLRKVLKISNEIRNNKISAVDYFENKEKIELKKHIIHLKRLIGSLKQEINRIKTSDLFNLIENISDRESYFELLHQILSEEITTLESSLAA